MWQPDVFGYSAALPQILRGCGVEFFVTTKIAENDATRFPHDTFHWQGIDGTTVLAHFNEIHCWPDPKTLAAQWKQVRHKDVQDRRLSAFGFGDGGGGPQYEQLEFVRRVGDLEGCPRTSYTSVSDFMRGLRDELQDLPTWVGELYLELHRGTLTSIAAVKRGNRRAEIALRDAELTWTMAALRGRRYPAARLLKQWKVLLLNQFHDILPGSSIPEVTTRPSGSSRAASRPCADWSTAPCDPWGGARPRRAARCSTRSAGTAAASWRCRTWSAASCRPIRSGAASGSRTCAGAASCSSRGSRCRHWAR
jgi:alpha-mannosidase